MDATLFNAGFGPPATILGLFHWLINPVLLYLSASLFVRRHVATSFLSVYLITYFVLIYAQAHHVYVHYVSNLTFLISVWSVPHLSIVGFAMAGALFRHRGTSLVATWNDIPQLSATDRYLLRILPYLSALFVIFPVMYIVDVGFHSLGFVYLVRNPGSALEAMTLRIGGLESRYGGTWLTAVYSYSRTMFFPLYLGVTGAYWSRGLISGFHMGFVSIAGASFALATGTKAPLAIFFATAFLAWYIARRQRFGLSGLAISVAILFVPALIYPLLYGVTDYWAATTVAWEGLWRRVVLVPSFVTAQYFEAFGNHFEYLGFASNRMLAAVAGEEYRAAAALMYNYAGGSIPGGLVNASYFASFYGDWGIPGVVMGALFAGFVLGCLQVFYDKSHNDVMGTGFRAANLIAVTQLMLTNFFSAGLGRGLLSIPIVLVFAHLALGLVGRVGRTFESTRAVTDPRVL